MYFIILGIVILILLFILIELLLKNRFQDNIIRINEAENNIDILLLKKLHLLDKAIKKIEDSDEKYINEGLSDKLIKLKNKNCDNFEMNKELDIIKANYKELLELDSKLETIEEIVNINFEMIDIENELKAAKKYYNKYIVPYNRLAKRFPSNIIAKLCHYDTKKEYFDEKIVDLEILKEK